MCETLKQGTTMSGFVREDENEPPRECHNCIWYASDKCKHPYVMFDPQVPGDEGKPKPVGHRDCCDNFVSPGRVLAYGIRHGTTEANENNLFRGYWDVPLDEAGRQDAKEAGNWLKDCGIRMVYCSPLVRAHETAKIICEILKLDEPMVDHRLLPWNIGKLSGQDRDEYREVLDHFIDHPDEVIPEGESLNDFADKIREAVEFFLYEARAEGIKAFVTHTSDLIQAENYVYGVGAHGRPEGEDSVNPGGVIVIREKKDKLSTKSVFKKNGPAEYGS